MDIKQPDGLVTTFRDDGSKLEELTYVRGVLHGPYRDYWSHGAVSLEGQYVNGLQEGEWQFYDPDTGELREVIKFDGGEEVVDWDQYFPRARTSNNTD